MPTCQGVTKKGAPCKRLTKTTYCNWHRKEHESSRPKSKSKSRPKSRSRPKSSKSRPKPVRKTPPASRFNGHGVDYTDSGFLRALHEAVQAHFGGALAYLSQGQWGVTYVWQGRYIVKVEAYNMARRKLVSLLTEERSNLIRITHDGRFSHIVRVVLDAPDGSWEKFEYDGEAYTWTSMTLEHGGVPLQPHSMDEASAQRLLYHQLLPAANDVAQAGYTHGDINFGNLLIKDDGHVTLIDFGTAQKHWREPARDRPSGPKGTDDYSSLRGQQGYTLTYRDDLESMVYFALHLCGQLPWSNSGPAETLHMKQTLHAVPEWARREVLRFRAMEWDEHL